MKKYSLPKDESERIRSLRELEILDTTAELCYDDLVFLASEICGVPIATLSLVDSERQWFKAKVGIEATETPRDISFCTHAILQSEIFEVPDAWVDPRFKDNPLVKGNPKIRFYAGAPLTMPDGQNIGTLCVIDREPRVLSQRQRRALAALARQAVFTLNERKIRKTLEIGRRRLHAALSELENANLNKEALLNNMSEGLALRDKQGKIVSHNPAALRILRTTSDQLLGHAQPDAGWKSIREDGSELPLSDHPSMVCLKTGKAVRGFLMGLSMPSGELYWISINSAPIFNEGPDSPSGVLTTFRDVTAEREANLNLIQSAKMSSLGVMAGGIAHEINTPLGTIALLTEMLSQKTDLEKFDKAEFKPLLDKIFSTVDRIAKTVRAMRVISRDTKNDQFQTVSLSEVVADAVSLCEEKISSNSVQISVRCDDLIFSGRSGEICQVILNLIANAADAVSESEKREIRVEGTKRGDVILLSVVDSGPGISNQVAARMMEPFFTTKPVGQGTGLGLSISSSIAQDHGGRLYRDAKSPQTKMVLELPVLKKMKRVA